MKKIPFVQPQTFPDIDPEVVPYTFHGGRHLHFDKDSNLISDFYLLTDIVLKKHRKFFLTGLDEELSLVGYEEFKKSFVEIFEREPDLLSKSIKEQNVIEHIIKPVLCSLGWNKYKNSEEKCFEEFTKYTAEEICLNGDKADLMLCALPGNAQEIAELDQKKSNDKGKKLLNSIGDNVVTILEAKTIKSLASGKKKSKKKSELVESEGKSASSQGPERQLIKYLNTYNKKLGILSDGRNWHLYYRDLSDSEIVRSFKFDLRQLSELVQDHLGDDNEFQKELFLRIFYFFFGKETHVKQGDFPSLLGRVFEDCDKYASLMNEALKPKFLQAMGLLTNAFKKKISSLMNLEDEELKLIRSTSESLLFQMIFIKSCEMNGVLPIEQAEYEEMSLKSIVECLGRFNPDNLNGKARRAGELEKLKRDFAHKMVFAFENDDIHYQVFKLITNINKNKTSLKIESFVESCFTKEEFKFFKDHKISNEDFAEVLFCLGYFEKDGENKEIPYNYLTPRQFGEIYETFLEFKLDQATQSLWWCNKKKRWNELKKWTENYDRSKEIRVKTGSLFFTPNNEDRQVSGSYYTPHHVVKNIVKNALEPIVQSSKNCEAIKKLKVCDPSMGSGHFLNYTLHFLTKQYREMYYNEYKSPIEESYNETSRSILDACIHGIDLNPSAVKLAKMSLWLSSAHRGKKLERLDDQLFNGNSITFEMATPEEQGYWDELVGNVDAIVGNPPYRKERDSKDEIEEIVKCEFGKKVYQGKMDLWYFFLHRSFEIAKTDAPISFIVPSYWMKSSGAKKLIQQIKEDGAFESIIDLGKNKIFKDVSGRHMIFNIINSSDTIKTNYIKLNESGIDEEEMKLVLKDFPKKFVEISEKVPSNTLISEEGTISIGSSEYLEFESIVSKYPKVEGENSHFLVAQGVVEAIDRITKKQAEKAGDPDLQGQGVFVLDKKEVKSLKLNSDEEVFLKDYIHSLDNTMYKNNYSGLKVIYTSGKDNKHILDNKSKYPNLVKHLDKMKDYITSSNAPYGLHRARKQEMFTQKKIIGQNMFNYPLFSLAEGESYVNFAFNVINENSGEYSLELLLACLNSSVGRFWFDNNAKKRGVNNDVGVGVLRNFPIPEVDAAEVKKIEKLSKSLSKKWNESDYTSLNELIFDAYAINGKLRSYIDEGYSAPELDKVA